MITSSTAGLKALPGDDGPGFQAYTASKHGVVGLMRIFATNYAPHNIRVNTVHPTGSTRPWWSTNSCSSGSTRWTAAGVDGLTNLLPVTLVEPEDISNAILWLVSDEARYVTGVTLPVDAGFTIR